MSSKLPNITVRPLNQDEYYLLDEFCESESIPTLSPEWSKVIVAIDDTLGKVVGIMVAQMQIHVEPIWISKGYRTGEVSKAMSDNLDMYLDVMSAFDGKPIGVWCQPTNVAAERICRTHGYEKCDKPLYTKIYEGKLAQELLVSLTKGGE